VVDEAVVEILTTQVGVTSGCQDLEDALVDSEDGHIEGTTAEIVDENLTFVLVSLVEAVGQSGGCRFIDHTQHVQTGDSACVLGGGTLGVVKVSRDGDNCGTFVSF
jgi:hypothetical protein